jgi:hypothetical protein
MQDSIFPLLIINRVIVMSHLKTIAYDEQFHHGVNIIRGDNSTGKSTIANLIFYGLGGDYKEWVDEALLCKEVFIEVELNGKVITLNREIAAAGAKPMNIFFGNYEKSKKQSTESWARYGYSKTDTKRSFTSVLFEALGFPEIRSQEDSNITMHQILRMMYVDQDSPIQSLMRFEQFDAPLTREAVAEVLLGVYSDELYEGRLKLRELKNTIGEKKAEYRSIKSAFKITESSISLDKIDARINKLYESIDKVEKEIVKLKTAKSVRISVKTKLPVNEVQDELQVLNREHVESKDILNRLDAAIVDSKLFIQALEKKLSAVKQSIITRNHLDELDLKFCPQCLRPLASHPSGASTCKLCKEEIEDKDFTQAFKIQQELTNQISESKTLLQKKIVRRELLDDKLQVLSLRQNQKQKKLGQLVNQVQTVRDDRMDQLFTEKGKLNAEIQYLSKQAKFAELLTSLMTQIEKIKGNIAKQEIEIEELENTQEIKLARANETIGKITKSLLRSDVDSENEFKNPKRVEANFRQNVFKLNDKFNFSASSVVLLKNSIRFAIFFASLEHGFFRYPRFILSDNMEDKGMKEDRSHNFQRQIVKLSNSYNVKHQIIFTTSMVDEELNADESLIVGDFYAFGSKSLKVAP